MGKNSLETRGIVRLLRGSTYALKRQRLHLKLAARPTMGIRRFFELVDPPRHTGTPPVFILSAGWRSGSTLLQRLVSSGEGRFIWGEPYDRSMIIQNMAQSLAPFEEKYPLDRFIQSVEQNSVAQIWAANLYPPAYRTCL